MDLNAAAQTIAKTDPDIALLVAAERERQEKTICLIPSENYMSAAVALALSSAFGNKYAEGYPHMWEDGNRIEKNGRYYRGQGVTNQLERLAIQRALALFTANPDDYHANVQPLSGAPANLAVLNAILDPGDVFMGLALVDGGHLTHGHNVSVTGRYYRAVQYGLGEDGALDYHAIERLAKQCSPKLIFCGATAYPLTIDFEFLGGIAKRVGAILAADISHICGLCVTGLHPHPFPHADIVTTTTHKILRGPRGGVIVCKREYGPAIDRSVFPGLQGGPHMNVIAAMAVAFQEAMSEAYRVYARQVVANAKALASALSADGFRLVGGRTENHLLLLDVVHSEEPVRSKNGARFAERLERAGIVANKNTIPGDEKPWIPSGVRLGTPAVTTLGMTEPDMKQIAVWISRVARHQDDEATTAQVRAEVQRWMQRFTVPGVRW